MSAPEDPRLGWALPVGAAESGPSVAVSVEGEATGGQEEDEGEEQGGRGSGKSLPLQLCALVFFIGASVVLTIIFLIVGLLTVGS